MNVEKMRMAGIDYEQGVNRFAGKASMYENFLLKFQNDPNYEIMMEKIQQNNLPEAFKAAHALKGVAGNLSLNRLYERTSELVEALRHEKTEEVGMLSQRVTESYEETMAALQE